MEPKKKYHTIDEYISGFPNNIQIILKELRKKILAAAPQAEEAMSYQIPTFKIAGKNLVHFAAYKNHIGFYPAPSGIKAFQKELSPWPSAKGSVKFAINKPLPLDLIEKIVKFRVNENKKG